MIASLLMSLAAAAMWVRSCWRNDDVFVGREATPDHWSHELLVCSWSGSIHLQFKSRDSEPSMSPHLWYSGMRSTPIAGPLRGEPWHRFYYEFQIYDANAGLMINGKRALPPETEIVRYASVPHAMVVLIYSVLPMVWGFRALGRYRAAMRRGFPVAA